MHIREATKLDVPEILKVLKASLGESSSQKTAEVWKFKHVDNPFGKSLVLVAIENDEIIGVRAFMRWSWQLQERIFTSLRAVDTATHPAHQGKGVFKKLTLEALKIAQSEGDNFIFNTPNSQSLPGYLKMGWKEIDKINIHFLLSNPLHWKKGPSVPNYELNKTCSTFDLQRLLDINNSSDGQSGKLFTVKSPEYLSWRYENNPIQSYKVVADKDFYMAAYLKRHTHFNELRISEHIFNQEGRKKLKRNINEMGKEFGAQLITFSSGLGYFNSISGKLGPIMTIRDLNINPGQKLQFQQINSWKYTLGDLELF